MNEHYSQDYSVLEIKPGCSFHDLKYSYRRLVRRWHPDRITAKRRARDVVYAENRIREITEAFRRLSEYYRKNGYLPGDEIEKKAAVNKPGPSHTTYSRPLRRKKNSFFSRAPRFMLAGAVLAIVYAFWSTYGTELDSGLDGSFLENPLHLRNLAPLSDYSQPRIAPGALKITENYFTQGSTIGEVISIQGVPTFIEGDVWHYGLSKVYFDKGVVVSWEQDPANLLKVDIMLPPHNLQAKTFAFGSTKSDVRAIQGSPLRENENMWEFRISRIYFKNGKVSGWYDSPFDPLKLPKQPPER